MHATKTLTPLGITLHAFERRNAATAHVATFHMEDYAVDDAVEFIDSALPLGHSIEVTSPHTDVYYALPIEEGCTSVEDSPNLEWILYWLNDLAVTDVNVALSAELNWNRVTSGSGRYTGLEHAASYIEASNADDMFKLGKMAENEFQPSEHEWIAWKGDTASFLTSEEYQDVCDDVLKEFVDEGIEDIVGRLLPLYEKRGV